VKVTSLTCLEKSATPGEIAPCSSCFSAVHLLLDLGRVRGTGIIFFSVKIVCLCVNILVVPIDCVVIGYFLFLIALCLCAKISFFVSRRVLD